jgi:hypothetical protein
MISGSSRRILYWPGMGRSPLELFDFYRRMEDNGYSIDIMPYEYDVGEKPHNPESCIYQWAENLSETDADWWIGLSLGASVAYLVASAISAESIPKRITLINPFADRAQLAWEKNFSLVGQWLLSPVNHNLYVPIVDIVLSLNDDRIPTEHGKQLLPMITATELRVIMLNADHAVSGYSAQLYLADILLRGRCA